MAEDRCLHLNAGTEQQPAAGGKIRYTTRCRDCGMILHEYEA